MKNNTIKKTISLALAIAAAVSLTACGSTDKGSSAAPAAAQPAASQPAASSQASTSSDDQTTAPADVKKIVFAYRNTGNWPVTGEDENGNPSGYDIEVLREVDALLPGYEFEYVGTSYDDAYVGLEAGNYDAALTNAFWTEARAEKYLISEQNLGASVLTLVVRKENADIKNLTDLSKSGLELAPLLAGNGMYYVVKTYNDQNPDAQVEIKTTDDSTYVAGSVEETVAGKYDASIQVKPSFDASVVSEDGDLHQFLDQISYSEFTLAKTYPMFSKRLGEDFLKEYNDALVQVVNSGKASEISQKFFNYDIFNYDFQ